MKSTQSEFYPPLAEARQSLRPDWYRCAIERDRLRSLSKCSDLQGWMQAGGHLSLYLILVAANITFWMQAQWWAFAVTLWCLGFVASFFKGTAPHELGHRTVFRSANLNRVFLYLFSLISWWDPFDYAASHAHHHRYTTHPQADRENLLPIQPSLHPLLLLQLFTVNVFSKPGRNFGKGGLLWTLYLTVCTAAGRLARHPDIPSQEWLRALHQDQPQTFRQSVQWSRLLLLFHGTLCALAIGTGWWVLPLVVTLPSFIAGCGSYFLGATQHSGLRRDVEDFRKNTRSIKLNPLMEFLYWHMNWHTEHHMYTSVPCYNLKALASEIADDMPPPRSLWAAWVEMRKISRLQRSDPDYEFDTPLPLPEQRL